MVQPVTDRVDGHSRTVVINAAENEIDRPTCKTSTLYSISHVLVSILSGNVHIVGFNCDFRVHGRQCLLCCLDLGEADLRRREEKSVHVGQLDLIVVIDHQFANPAPRQHLSSHRPNPSHPNNQNALQLDLRIVLNNPHLLESHESTIRIIVLHRLAHPVLGVRFRYDLRDLPVDPLPLLHQLLNKQLLLLHQQVIQAWRSISPVLEFVEFLQVGQRWEVLAEVLGQVQHRTAEIDHHVLFQIEQIADEGQSCLRLDRRINLLKRLQPNKNNSSPQHNRTFLRHRTTKQNHLRQIQYNLPKVLLRLFSQPKSELFYITSQLQPACLAMSQTDQLSILKSSTLTISDYLSSISVLLNFFLAILSQTTPNFSGWISSYFEAENIAVRPIRCRSLTYSRYGHRLRQESMRKMALKKVSSVILQDDSTSIIQSTILERRPGLISCRSSIPRDYSALSHKWVRMSIEQSFTTMSVQSFLSWLGKLSFFRKLLTRVVVVELLILCQSLGWHSGNLVEICFCGLAG